MTATPPPAPDTRPRCPSCTGPLAWLCVVCGTSSEGGPPEDENDPQAQPAPTPSGDAVASLGTRYCAACSLPEGYLVHAGWLAWNKSPCDGSCGGSPRWLGVSEHTHHPFRVLIWDTPALGEPRKCLVCALDKPWGTFSTTTGESVCVDCRDARHKLAAAEARLREVEGALMLAAIPLEVLRGAAPIKEIAPAVYQSIAEAVEAMRAALARSTPAPRTQEDSRP